MKIKIVLAIALCLMAIAEIASSENSSSAEGKFLVSLQETNQVELYVTSWCPYFHRLLTFSSQKEFTMFSTILNGMTTRLAEKKNLTLAKAFPLR